MAGDQPFVTILRTTDPVRAEVLRDLLQQEGIPVTMTGQHHNSLLGAAGFLIEIPIRVPRDRVEEAVGIVNALDDESSVLVDEHGQPTGLGSIDAEPEFEPETRRADGEGPYRSAPERRSRPRSPRLRRVAAFLATAIGFGTGHHYAREWVAGGILTASELAAFAIGLTFPEAMLAVPAIRLVDLLGSLRACERYNASRRLGPGSQVVRTAGLVAGSVGLSVGVMPPLVEALRPAPEPVPESEVREVLYPSSLEPRYPFADDPDVEEVTADDLFDRRRRVGGPGEPPPAPPESAEEGTGAPRGAAD